MPLKKVNLDGNPYCGPAVLSILTGKTTDECAAVFTKITGRRNIEQVYPKEIEAALKILRFDIIPIASDCSLFSLFHQIHSNTGMYVVIVPKHVVAVESTIHGSVLLCDNHTKEPINLASMARLGQRVTLCYKVEPKPEPKLLSSSLDVKVDIEASRKLRVTIYRRNEYDDVSMNNSNYKGSFIVDDETELKQIRDEFLRRF